MLHSEPIKLHGELNVANESVYHELRHMVLRGLTTEPLIAPHNKKRLLDQITLSCFSCVFSRVTDVNSVICDISVFHFRVDFCLCVETSLCAKPFKMMKICFPTGLFLCKSNSFSYEKFRSKTRFETEARGNSEMAYSFSDSTQILFCFVH